ncbi:MAG: hypothetical protein L6R41_003895 [Letrouitia leprolyta]|nr:MAG: hypothetical protein L6R41_003895 [Letrouitia leprolyta]
MSGQPGYWIWDERHQDYYHAQFNNASGQNPPSQPPPQPVDPYGATPQNTNALRNYAYSQSSRGTDLGSLTRDFGNLTTTAGYGAYSPSVTAPPRSTSLAQGIAVTCWQQGFD